MFVPFSRAIINSLEVGNGGDKEYRDKNCGQEVEQGNNKEKDIHNGMLQTGFTIDRKIISLRPAGGQEPPASFLI